MRKLPLDETREQAAPRFWARVSKAPHPKGCWEWQGGRDRRPGRGYGAFRIWGKTQKAHRVAFWLNSNEWPGDLFVLHECDNPTCVNPAHLTLGDHRLNMNHRRERGRNTVYQGENNACSKVTAELIPVIREAYSLARRTPAGNLKRGEMAALVERFGFSEDTIRRIAQRKLWKHVP